MFDYVPARGICSADLKNAYADMFARGCRTDARAPNVHWLGGFVCLRVISVHPPGERGRTQAGNLCSTYGAPAQGKQVPSMRLRSLRSITRCLEKCSGGDSRKTKRSRSRYICSATQVRSDQHVPA